MKTTPAPVNPGPVSPGESRYLDMRRRSDHLMGQGYDRLAARHWAFVQVCADFRPGGSAAQSEYRRLCAGRASPPVH